MTRFINIEREIRFNAGGRIFLLARDLPQTLENVLHSPEKEEGVLEDEDEDVEVEEEGKWGEL